MRSQRVALGVGSNLQFPLQQLRRALSLLKNSELFKVLNVSALYESQALLPDGASPDWNKNFLNAVVLCELKSEAAPEKILFEVKKIEKNLGRIPAERWSPRVIDIDVLYWDQVAIQSMTINIPHQHLFDRPFALLPLLDVWPEVRTIEAARIPVWASGWAEKIPLSASKSTRYLWPRMVGVLNVTEDSFSDGGRYLSNESLQKQVLKMIDQGTEILDVGAESTRPQAKPVDDDIEFENLDRALNEIRRVSPEILISLDCRKPQVVSRILERHRLDFLNDVSGFENREMQLLLKKTKCSAFVMHSLSIPPSSENILNERHNPCVQLTNWWYEKKLKLLDFGIEADRLVFDPGIGFGKSKLQNLYILKNLELFNDIKNDVMIGHSRKSYLTHFIEQPPDARDLATAMITRQLNLAFVQYLRVHDVESQNIALRFA